jgi:hypothetical protein
VEVQAILDFGEPPGLHVFNRGAGGVRSPLDEQPSATCPYLFIRQPRHYIPTRLTVRFRAVPLVNTPKAQAPIAPS